MYDVLHTSLGVGFYSLFHLDVVYLLNLTLGFTIFKLSLVRLAMGCACFMRRFTKRPGLIKA